MSNNGITALMGVGGAILLMFGIVGAVITPIDFETVSVYYGLGQLVMLLVFLGSGAVLIYLFFKRTRKTPHIKA